MIKKSLILLTILSFVSSCNITPLNLSKTDSNNSMQSKSFSIKSTTNLNEIKKSFLPITKITKLKKKDDEEKWKKFTFNTSNQDLNRKFILNLINGIDIGENVGNIEVKINGETIIFNHDEDLDNTDDISKIKKKLCKEPENEHNKNSNENDDDKKFKTKHHNDKNEFTCSTLITNFFNRKTESLSVNLPNILEGINTLEIRVKDERKNYSLGISIDGFLEPYKIEGAIHSLIPRDKDIRQSEYYKGILGIKFLEGTKVRLITDENGNQKFTDLNGISLEMLNKFLREKKFKLASKSINIPDLELDQNEILVENSIGVDTPNLNLFFRIKVDDNADIWSLSDEIRKLPYIEESYPYFVPKEPIDSPNDPQIKGILFKNTLGEYFQYSNSNSSSVLYHNDKDPIYKSDWLRFMHVMENDIDSGVWIRTQGNNSITSAVLGHGFQHYDLGFGNNTHEDLGNIIALNNIEVSGMNGNDGYLTHETASIGIIGATANNGKGIAGISHNVKTIGIQAYGAKKNSNNIYEPFTIESACKGNGKYLKDLWKWEWGCDSTVDSMYLAKKNNAKTIIIEGTTSSPFEQPANELRAVIPYFVNSGINVIIPAANNYNKDIRKFNTTTWYGSPITVDMPDTGSVIVSGLSLDGSKRHIGSDNVYYNYGVSKAGGTNNLYTSGGHGVDVGGPAEESFTTWVYKNNLSATNNYDRFGGTSGASPAITAIINLMLSLNSSLTPYEIRKILRETRQDNLLLGNDKITGSTPTAGMVDAWKALNAVSPFTTTAGNPSSSYGYKIQGTTLDSSNVITNNSQIPVNMTTEPNKVLAAPILGTSNGITIKVGGQNANIIGYAPNTIGFTVPNGVNSGLQDVTISTPNGDITFDNALKIINNTMTKHFPESITINGVTTNLDYGLKLEFNECSGNLVEDSSGNNNDADFLRRNSIDNFPSWLIDTDYGCGVNFTDSPMASLRVKDNNSFEPGLKKDSNGNYQTTGKSTIIVVVKNDINVTPSGGMILSKWNSINYINNSYGVFNSSENVYYSIYNGDLGFVNFEGNSPYENTNQATQVHAISSSLDLDNDKFIIMKNGVEGTFTLYQDPGGISGVQYPNYIQNSTHDLFIGNYIPNNDILGVTGVENYKGTIYGVAIIKQALNQDQIREVIKGFNLR